MGAALRGRARDAFVLSTKVGRLILPIDRIPPGPTSIGRPSTGARMPTTGGPARCGRCSTTRPMGFAARSRRVSGASGLERIDIAYIHDPDDHWQAAIDGAYPALHRMREEGLIGAIGAGMNQSAMLARFAREGDFDVFLLAGRYTLLDQEALPELLPLCVERGIAIVLGGVMNSGILADPRPGACSTTTRQRRRWSSGHGGSTRSAPGTGCRSRRPRSSSRSPTRRSSRSWRACVGWPTWTTTRLRCACPSGQDCGPNSARRASSHQEAPTPS